MADRVRPKRSLPGGAAPVPLLLAFIAWGLPLGIISLALAPPVAAQTKAKGAGKARSPKAEKEAAAKLAQEKALLQQTLKVQGSHLKALEPIARWAAANGLKKEAGEVVASMARLDADHPALAKLRAAVEKAAAEGDPAKLESNQKAYLKKVESANDQNGKRLFALAAQCMNLALFTRAFDLVQAVLEADPDHEQARKVLGYARDPQDRKLWITKWEAQMKATHVLTEEGWVKKSDKKRWDKGERPYEGKWIRKEEEERARQRGLYNPYSVETEHFEVKSNVGRAKAFEYALLLEDFYRQFFRFYIGFYDQVRGAELLFNQAKLKKKHTVLIFPSRADFLTFVKAVKGNNEILRGSAGLYVESDRSSYLFWSEDSAATLSTLYHEVTHELFAETKEGSGGSRGNVWVPEGIATYMETWEKVEGKWLPGQNTNVRELQLAQQHLAQNPDWSLASFIGLDHKGFHETPARSLHYGLAAALAHFLLHFEGGLYREHFIQYISAYYGGKAIEDSLPTYIPVEGAAGPGGKLEVLEKQFKEYMSRLGSPGASPAAEAAAREEAPAPDGKDES